MAFSASSAREPRHFSLSKVETIGFEVLGVLGFRVLGLGPLFGGSERLSKLAG